ncbi:hypothetical protein [Candidatus Viridilinea mediisalina]|uniref:Uncharacterized protein n=1 Tax=Candidatus Viridilinea mediisalina TaxID=2024553 RepID=A0A2A6REA5_9CHLR|nr:hypothetical protein [Candidatus Viridilinea mediisalina]PDW01353.1 hypothetical protein CJ255_19310 [Candidatus Viridilinea mediisalina]
MEAKHYDRLLRQIALHAEVTAQGYELERAYAQLDDYITSELAGEAVQERFPEVAFFLATNEDFGTIYQALRRHALNDDPAVALDEPVDLERLSAYVDGRLTLEPNDLARPLSTPPSRADREQAYVLQLLPYWQQHLPQRGGLFMDAGDDSVEAVEIPECTEPAWLDLVLNQEDDGAVVDGQVRPLHAELLQAPVRLYRVEATPTPKVTLHTETQVDRFGHFAFHTIAPGRYVLALVLDDEIVGTTWLDV